MHLISLGEVLGQECFAKFLLSLDGLMSVVDQTCCERTLQTEIAVLHTVVALDGDAFLLAHRKS